MIYSKRLWLMGIVFLIIGIYGVTQNMVMKSLGFFPLAVSAFTIYDKEDPKVKYKKLREALFTIGLVLALLIWLFGPKLFPNL